MDEEQRKALVESGPVYLQDGRRASFVGWLDPYMCGVSSGRPGFWATTWETAAAVAARPSRRFEWGDTLFKTGDGWFGVPPRPEDYQTPEDYERAVARER